ncbi:DUF4389 domain-containing protein [Cryobacterium sp. PAMC25264]|uniref:DUF4389 domain-containing protein n=1 Tax=Cryobacterium sp. PAMC25264 TaxID=2861288 RepID=UPI001C625C27|nr:DUF4389 domain-containing protein [Cryobacterium sp. PAMC25264]QYF73914.1 DUF4389 domain-containing protein [Cryobacterium sp. PAMC25264]
MKPGPLVMLLIGTIVTLLGFGLTAAGTVAAIASGAQGENGYFSTRSASFVANSYALTTPTLGPVTTTRTPPPLNLDIARIRLEATSRNGADVFIGVAPRTEVDSYLASVAHTEVSGIQSTPFRVDYRQIAGSERPEPPEEQSWWAASAAGPGTQEITWSVQPGAWAVVVMNADASRPVAVDLRAGVRSGLLGPAAAALLLTGLITLVIGLALVMLGVIGLGRNGPAPSSRPDARGTQPPLDPDRPGADYPARLNGWLQPGLSRALWLVKWVLVIPHYIVLFFLWFGFWISTIVAGFAILFTGRYPRAIFNYNVGVLRWNWRVAFYAYSALGTDRYPPFTLAATDYPADLEVDYPERLSHGLVLVKSWLLAIPHLIIVTIITGGTWAWTASWNNWGTGGGAGTSLLTVLVLIAAVVLLFSGRYRRGIFDLILGLNRWLYRVIVYAALMRDEYPPFRLDQGPIDPGSLAPAGRPVPATAAPAAPAPAAAPPAPGPTHAPDDGR